MAKDYYDILGVSKDADQTEIKKAFRKIAKEFHPDHNKEPGAAEKFKEANEAFSVLSDPEKRKQYDSYGYDGSKADGGGMGGFGGMGGQDFGGFSANFGDLGDFGDLGSVLGSFFGGSGFGGGGVRKPNNRGSDLSMKVTVDFNTAVFGGEKNVTYVRKAECDVCSGTGSKDGNKNTCSMCKGSGRVRRTTQTLFGAMATETICPTCQGEGYEIKNPCPNCSGTGRITKSSELTIKIPAGAESGVRMKFPGKGDFGVRGGASGDLYIVLETKEDKRFRRSNGDVASVISIDPSLAVLGGEIEIPTVNGNVKMKVPKGTQSGKEFRLREKGGPRLRGGGVGDHFVTINVEIPSNLSAEEKKLWERLSELRGSKEKGFWEKLFE